jgi:lysophospholipid acyltransferase (LPLAT)-like uncharacterized protein
MESVSVEITPDAPPPPEPERRFTLRQRILLRLITGAGVLAVRLIAPTLRLAVSLEPDAPPGLEVRPLIYCFWHNCLFPAMYIWRNLQIRVLSSDSFDGEYTGRIMRKFGFVKVRGSSSRGAVRAVFAMRRELQQGACVAFTIDGPKGPRYVAKPGPVVLARSTGVPMVVFHIALEDAWILKTWDGCMIPKPFSRALMRLSSPIRAAPATEDGRAAKDQPTTEELHRELQASLDRVRVFAEANVRLVGQPAFPRWKRKA